MRTNISRWTRKKGMPILNQRRTCVLDNATGLFFGKVGETYAPTAKTPKHGELFLVHDARHMARLYYGSGYESYCQIYTVTNSDFMGWLGYQKIGRPCSVKQRLNLQRMVRRYQQINKQRKAIQANL